jgi:hypothetical protein
LKTARSAGLSVADARGAVRPCTASPLPLRDDEMSILLAIIVCGIVVTTAGTFLFAIANPPR